MEALLGNLTNAELEGWGLALNDGTIAELSEPWPAMRAWYERLFSLLAEEWARRSGKRPVDLEARILDLNAAAGALSPQEIRALIGGMVALASEAPTPALKALRGALVALLRDAFRLRYGDAPSKTG